MPNLERVPVGQGSEDEGPNKTVRHPAKKLHGTTPMVNVSAAAGDRPPFEGSLRADCSSKMAFSSKTFLRENRDATISLFFRDSRALHSGFCPSCKSASAS